MPQAGFAVTATGTASDNETADDAAAGNGAGIVAQNAAKITVPGIVAQNAADATPPNKAAATNPGSN